MRAETFYGKLLGLRVKQRWFMADGVRTPVDLVRAWERRLSRRRTRRRCGRGSARHDAPWLEPRCPIHSPRGL
ncbi:MAG: hypothetical protein QM784_01005 [Polyangiaceae bacterium]